MLAPVQSDLRRVKILPSMLAADFMRLGEDVAQAMAAGGDLVHIDIMDGHFAPNLSFGPEIVRQLRKVTSAPFDVHLMVAPVDPYLGVFAQAGADVLTVHIEAGPHVHRTLQAIRGLGKKAGVALNPGTPASAVEALIDDVDLILAMSVNPGFGGQKFIPATLDKIRALRALVGGRNIVIEADGGIGAENAGDLARAGVDWLVAGSSIFKDGPSHYARNIGAIRLAADNALGIAV